MTFLELGLAEPIVRATTAEGYTTATPIQEQAIPHVLRGSDVLGCAQTGTGKTAAFALPILNNLMLSTAPQTGPAHRQPPRRPRALILSPTRELASQIDESLHAYGRHTGLRGTVIYGGVSQNPQAQSIRRGVDIIVATPGRLLDLMNQRLVDLSTIEIFVLDEADRMLDMGFMPDLQRIIATLPAQRQNLLFSATMPGPIAKLAHDILVNPARIDIAPVQETTELIEQSVCFVPGGQKTRLLTRYLGEPTTKRSIVFTRTKHGADRVVRQLEEAGVVAEAIHGNKSQAARQRTLIAFKANRVQVLVATDLAARGIDVDGVSHVFNYDLPREPETYTHRIGRTGRAGQTGIAIAFCSADERSMLRAIERQLGYKLRVEVTPFSVDPAEEVRAPRPQQSNFKPRRPQGQGQQGGPPARPRKPQGEQQSQQPAKPRPPRPAAAQGEGGHHVHGEHGAGGYRRPTGKPAARKFVGAGRGRPANGDR